METLLLGQPFVVKTNQQSLKYLMDQKIGTPVQQKWITKLLGYNFDVQYEKWLASTSRNSLKLKIRK